MPKLYLILYYNCSKLRRQKQVAMVNGTLATVTALQPNYITLTPLPARPHGLLSKDIFYIPRVKQKLKLYSAQVPMIRHDAVPSNTY